MTGDGRDTWHRVAAADELVGDGPIQVLVAGERWVVGRLDGDLAAARDLCPHRLAPLSAGCVVDNTFQCPYHGYRFDGTGRCVEIPSMPLGPIPEKACISAYEVTEQYGLVWIRLDDRAGTVIPAHPAYDDEAMKIVHGVPYTWPVGAPRRVENFVDLAHFAWVHDGSLGRRDEPVPPLPTIIRESGELRFAFDPPEMEVDDTALFGHSEYRMPMPLTVSIEFWLAGGAKRHLWMTACPIDMATTRTFWTVSRNDDVDGDDAPHMAFQALVLAEDEPVVCNQDPPELHLEPGFELSVRTDRVSIEYRRWLGQIAAAAATGPDEVAAIVAASNAPRLADVGAPA